MSKVKENEQFYQAVRNGVYDAVMTIMEAPTDLSGYPITREAILRAIKHGVFDGVAFSDIEKLIASSEEERGQAEIDQMIVDFKQSHGLPGEKDA